MADVAELKALKQLVTTIHLGAEDRPTDLRIFNALNGGGWTWVSTLPHHRAVARGSMTARVPSYLTSIDAALTLVKESDGLRVERVLEKAAVAVGLWPQHLIAEGERPIIVAREILNVVLWHAMERAKKTAA